MASFLQILAQSRLMVVQNNSHNTIEYAFLEADL
jgi:hypothetical protein